MIKRLESILVGTINLAIVACLAIMLVMVFGNVVLRYAFNSGITISEEVSRVLFVWMTFLGAIVATKDHAHLGIDTLVRRFPPLLQRICLAFTSLAILFVCALLLIGSWRQTMINTDTAFSATGLPVAIQYATGIVASIGIGAYMLRNIWIALRAAQPEETRSPEQTE